VEVGPKPYSNLIENVLNIQLIEKSVIKSNLTVLQAKIFVAVGHFTFRTFSPTLGYF